jgi:subtilisin family serine protease
MRATLRLCQPSRAPLRASATTRCPWKWRGASNTFGATDPLGLVNLAPLMRQSTGRAAVAIGLVDGPVATWHSDLASQGIQDVPGACRSVESAACRHGTLVAGILTADRGSSAPGICPGCTLLIRPIFGEAPSPDGKVPTARPSELTTALVDCVEAGAWVINVSAVVSRVSTPNDGEIAAALDYAARRGTIVVAASGNDASVGSSPVTRHWWTIPVVPCDDHGVPLASSNLGGSIGQRGLRAPGLKVTSLAAAGGTDSITGSSAAAPFVTGTIALLWSILDRAPAVEVASAVRRAREPRPRSVVPPLLDAWSAYGILGRAVAGAESA